VFQEEKTFNLRFTLEATFPDDYDGDQDGQMWVKEWSS